MTQPSNADNHAPRRSRTRRREAMVNAIATILGCMALVVMIATVVRVVMVKLWESAKVNPDYVESVYEDEKTRKWSGKTTSEPALLEESSHEASKATPTQIAQGPSVSTGNASLLSLRPGPTHAEVTENSILNIESKRSQIESTLRQFFEADDIGQKLAFVRDPLRVRPLMERYYKSRPSHSLEWKSLGWVLPVEEPGFRLGYAQAILANAEPVSVIMEELADGSFRVDWESSVRYGELDWGEFIKTQPESPKLFRVIASKPRHAPPEGTPQDSEVLEIKHPDDADMIYAYFDRKDPKFQPLIQQLQTGNWKDVPLTLRLCYPGPAGSGKSARIADVEGKGWLILHGTRS